MIKSLDERQLKEFQRIYKSHFGKEISKAEAYQQGINLVEFVRNILENIKINNKEDKNADL